MPRLLLFLIFILSPLLSIAQDRDSTTIVRKNNVRFVFSLDGRRSFIGGHRVGIGGLRLGIQYKDRFRTGLGFYGSDAPFKGNKRLNKDTPKERRLRGQLNFGYSALFFEPIFFKNKRWEISTPIILGVGDAKLTFYNPDSSIFSSTKQTFSLLELSSTVEYKFLRWAGLGAGLGYRTVFSEEKFITDNFNAPIYIIKVKIFIGELYRGIRKKRKDKLDNNN